MRTCRVKPHRKDSFAGNPQIRGGPRRTHVKETLKQIRYSRCENIDADEKHGFEFQAFDVLDIENAHLARVPDDPSFLAANDSDISLLQYLLCRGDQGIDPVVSVHEHCNRGQSAY